MYHEVGVREEIIVCLWGTLKREDHKSQEL